LKSQSLALTLIFLSISVTLLFSIFSLQINDEAFAKQLLLYAVFSLITGLGIFAFLIIGLLVQRAQGREEELDYEEV